MFGGTISSNLNRHPHWYPQKKKQSKDLITSYRVCEGLVMGLKNGRKPTISKGLLESSGCLRTNLEMKQKGVLGAEGGTRTRTGSLPLPPQDSVSTSSTTTARNFMLATTG